MPSFSGALVTIEEGNGATPEVFTMISGARNVRWSLGGRTSDTTTADDIDAQGRGWVTQRSALNDFSVSTNGLIKDAAVFNSLIASKIAGTIKNYRLTVGAACIFVGPMTVTEFGGSGPFDAEADYDLTLVAAGVITYTPTP